MSIEVHDDLESCSFGVRGVFVYLRKSVVSLSPHICLLICLVHLSLGLCLFHPLLHRLLKYLSNMVLLTTTTRVPLFVIHPNLPLHTLWVEVDVIIHALQVRVPIQRSSRQSNSVWDVLILLQIPQLRREIPIHCRRLFLFMSRNWRRPPHLSLVLCPLLFPVIWMS